MELFAGAVFTLMGTLILISMHYQWDWLMKHYKVKSTINLLDHKWGVIFYQILGIICILIGSWVMIEALIRIIGG